MPLGVDKLLPASVRLPTISQERTPWKDTPVDQLYRGDRVEHISGRKGIVIRTYNKRGPGGDLVEYAKVRMDGKGVSDHEEHPTITLKRIKR